MNQRRANMTEAARTLKEATGSAAPSRTGRSPCSPASGRTCRSRRSASSPPAGAMTGWRSPAGATTSTSQGGRGRQLRQGAEGHARGYGLGCWAISNHLNGQAVCELIDDRHKNMVNPRVWGDGDPEGVRQRAAEEMKTTARAAAAFGVDTVVGFTGSSIWHYVAMFPPVGDDVIQAGYPTSPTAGTRSSTSSTRSVCGSRTRCTRARSPTTTGPPWRLSRRSGTGPRSG